MRGKIEWAEAGVLRGWAWDEQVPDRKLDLEVHINGSLAGVAQASQFRGDLRAAGIGDGHHGFEFVVPVSWRDGKEHVVVLRLPDAPDAIVCKPAQLSFGTQATTIVGRVEGVRGVRVVGWAWDRLNPQNRLELEIFHQGKMIGTAIADQYRSDLKASHVGDGAHGFWFAPNATTFKNAGVKTLEIEVRVAEETGGQKIGEAVVSEPARPATAPKSPTKPKELPPAPTTPSATAKPAKPAAEKKPSNPYAKLSKVSEFVAAATKPEQEKDFSTAAAILREGLKRKPDQFDLLFRLARVLLAKGETAEAKAIAGQALKMRPGHEKPAITLARAAEVEGQRNLSLEYWKFVPPPDSSYAERQIKSSRMLLALERVDEALACLRLAAQLRPTDQGVARALAQLLEDLSDQEGAAREWERLAALAPHDNKLQAKAQSLRSNWQEPERVKIPAQFRGAMNNLSQPVLLAIGDELVDCLGASRLLMGLAAHFEALISIAVPSMTPAVRLVFEHHPNVRQILVAGEESAEAEVAFVLPEYLMTHAGVQPPKARTAYNFVEMRSVKSSDPHRRYEDYARWISDLSGMPLNLLSPMPGVAKALAKPAGNTVLFAHTDVPRGAMASKSLRSQLLKNVKVKGFDCKLWELDSSNFRNATDAALRLFETVCAAAVVVTGSEDVALLTLACARPLIWLASDQAGLANALSPASMIPLASDASDDGGLLLARLQDLGITRSARADTARPRSGTKIANVAGTQSKISGKTGSAKAVSGKAPTAAKVIEPEDRPGAGKTNRKKITAPNATTSKSASKNSKQSLTKKRAK